MKKLIIPIIAIIFLFSCKKEEAIIPLQKQTSSPITTTSIDTVNFNGVWLCNNWIVNTTVAHVREFTFLNKKALLKDYNTGNQLFTDALMITDSNYFDIPMTSIGHKYKGVMINDTTITMYQYFYNNSINSNDTVQIKDFIKQ